MEGDMFVLKAIFGTTIIGVILAIVTLAKAFGVI